MRIVIDLQGMQTRSSFRGIGRYTKSLSRALIKNRGSHEIVLALNGLMPETIESIRAAFADLIPPRDIRIWQLPGPVCAGYKDRDTRRAIAEIIREAFIAYLKPDVLLVSSLFEGYGDDAVTSVGAFIPELPTAVILYDLIPYLNPADYLDSNPGYARYYNQRINYLRRADLKLAISAYTAEEACRVLDLSCDTVVNISSACAGIFHPYDIPPEREEAFCQHLGVRPGFILYTGGADTRKNLTRLIRAYATLAPELRASHQLVLAGNIDDTKVAELIAIRNGVRLTEHDVRLIGYVADEDLIVLYNLCHLFVFPSLYEGFGLPVLEAMACGAAVIGANATSIPEVIANPDALFDPKSETSISGAMARVLTNRMLRNMLINRGRQQADSFSWDETAIRVINALEKTVGDKGISAPVGITELILPRLITAVAGLVPSGINDSELCKIAYAIDLSKNNSLPGLAGYDLLKSSANETQVENNPRETSFNSCLDAPYVFTSSLCRQAHFILPLYSEWCHKLGEKPRWKRKQWEFVYICQTLLERKCLMPGLTGLGFGVGKEPLTAFFARCGVSILASDQNEAAAKINGWVSSNQHGCGLHSLNERGLCPPDIFAKLVEFREIDMNNIPIDIGRFDFCWSSCAFEHLGSIKNGLDFVVNSAKLLKPGGVAVHTTEFNVYSDDLTIDNNPGLVLFRKRDIEQIISTLSDLGFCVEPVDYTPGNDIFEKYIDFPPYLDEPHLRLSIGGFVTTSLGLVVHAPK